MFWCQLEMAVFQSPFLSSLNLIFLLFWYCHINDLTACFRRPTLWRSEKPQDVTNTYVIMSRENRNRLWDFKQLSLANYLSQKTVPVNYGLFIRCPEITAGLFFSSIPSRLKRFYNYCHSSNNRGVASFSILIINSSACFGSTYHCTILL